MSEQNQRETKTVKVGAHEIVMHTYITGREARDIEGALIDNIEVKQGIDGGAQISGMKGSQLKMRQDEQIKAVVVSIDGVTDNVLDLVLDLPHSESEQIMELVREIADPKKEQVGS